jgi:hypothetical protein
MRLLMLSFLAVLLAIVAPLPVFAAIPTGITCTPMVTFNSNTALPGRVVCPISVAMSDGSQYTGPITLSGTNSSDFTLLSNRGLLVATFLSAGSYDVTLTAGSVSTSLIVPVVPLGQTPTGLSCAPVTSFTTATALANALVCPIAVTTSNGSPFTGTLSIGNGGSSSSFAISSSTSPANLIIATPLTVSGTYTPQIVAQTAYGSLAVMISVTVSSPVIGKATTHLYNNQRTGWNSTETVLNTSNVATSFGLVNSVPVDEQVDAQPLVVTPSSGDDQVFVATENNTVYRIDAATGAILQSRNLGAPVPMSSLPGSCSNNSAVVGITSSPVIDISTQTLYVMTYTMESGSQVYRIHALDLETLADKIGSGVVVTASGVLSNSTNYTFNAAVSRQRSALLEANGNIYAGFASFCDFAASSSRGWMLGWNASTLAPLAANQLVNQQASSTNNFFLSSIWMSGAGPAADESGNLFFATSNSDPGGASYDPVLNLCESVVEMSPDLSTVIGAFTPTQSPDSQPTLDAGDLDLGAGGVLLIPQQSSLPIPYLALSVGKAGYYYLIDRGSNFAGPTSLGKISQRLASVDSDCHCANSYFMGADGVPRVVTSLNNVLRTFKLQASGGSVVMTPENTQALSSGQDGGFFTSVSSNGTTAGSAVIWAVTRPTSSPYAVHLVAFDNPENAIIYTSSGTEAGIWPNTNANANLVPVVADGRVFVGSYKNLAIFGIGGSP